ncbi:reverse transcriptase [Phytophthora megakarya]|uniref:Reverse transcriptase n=1 Tax=Phytophthora megakarya TaxID=4795 RepID=A0A225VLY2_9STRA|nr:reverse transcriptase [Phytophthora megakarya]
MVTTRSRSRQIAQVEDPSRPLDYRDERWRRIKVHQDEGPELKRLKDYMKGDLLNYTRKEVKKIAKGSDRYVLDSRDVLYRLTAPTPERPRDKRSELRLVVPEDQRSYTTLTRISRLAIKASPGHMSVCVQIFSGLGCFKTSKCLSRNVRIARPLRGDLRIQDPLPRKNEPTGPFEVVSMDFVTHLPKSERGNAFLLLFQDMFTGDVMCKPMSSITAQDCAEAYEEVVFRNYGASSEIRHVRDPRFMSRVFRRFSEMMGIQQNATLAYRPQANDQQKRSSQTIMHSIRAYVEEPDQTDWDDHAEKLMHAINASFDATRLDTPFYLLHGWAQNRRTSQNVPRTNGVKNCNDTAAMPTPVRKSSRREPSTQKWKVLSDHLKSGFEVGDSVWLYIPKVLPGLSRKLAHCGTDHSGLNMIGTISSRQKPRALFPKRTSLRIDVLEEEDFDAALLLEDSWEPDSVHQEYEVEEIVDLRWTKRTRNAKRIREYLIKWKGYHELQWLPVSQLNCGSLLYKFNQPARANTRFAAMQSGNNDYAEL